MREVRATTALVWNYFDVSDAGNKKAICRYCKNFFSFRSTITNLKFHLRTKHPEVYKEFHRTESALRNIKEDESDEESQSSLWNYFERESGGRARCAVCCTSVQCNETSLRDHLRKKHPKLLFDVSKDTEQQEEEQNDDVYTEVVYLEDTTRKEDKKSYSPKRVSKPRFIEKKRSASNSSDEIVLKKRRQNDPNTSDDEIDTFGSYLICLLKKFPKNVCMKLQRDIINLVMNAKIGNLESENESKLVIDSNITRNEPTSYYVIQNKTNSNESHDVQDNSSAALENHSYSITIAAEGEKNEADRKN